MTDPRHAILLGLVALGLTGPALANRYTIVDLGLHAYPEQIGSQGDIAGNTLDGYGNFKQAKIYRDGSWTRLRSGGNSGPLIANAINAEADVVGTASDRDTPLIWRSGAHKPETIALPAGANAGAPAAISGDGTIVGLYANQDSAARCFRTTSDGNAEDFGFPPGSDCFANSINSAGEVAGSEREGVNPFHAFIWIEGVPRDLGVLPRDTASYGLSINDQDQVVGTSIGDTKAEHAFLWSNGHMKYIGRSPDFFSTEAEGVNNRGEIVGVGFDRTLLHRQHAVRFANGAVIDLRSEVVHIGDWDLKKARSINDDGVIVGWGRRSDGMHGFELVPKSSR